MKKHESERHMGFADKSGSGGYEKIQCDDGHAQSLAQNLVDCNDAAANVQATKQPNHVGGPYAST